MITKIIKNFIKITGILIFLFILFTLVFWLLANKKNNREWEFGQEKIPEVIFLDNGEIEIENIRDFNWKDIGNKSYWKNIKFNISDIEKMEVGVSHFHSNEGIGHVFLIFKLKDGRDFALSVESRRELGEEFTFLGGIKFDYEISYFLATKNDLISLREERKERVYIYPIKTTSKKTQKAFNVLAKRINSLKDNPEFYHIIFKNCTNSITREIEKISDKSFPIWERTFVPGYADRALFQMGLIETDKKDFEEMKKDFLIDFKK